MNKIGDKKVKLPKKWTKFFIRHEETGMGYQVATIKLKSDRELKVTILNGEEIILPKGKRIFKSSDIKNITFHFDV